MVNLGTEAAAYALLTTRPKSIKYGSWITSSTSFVSHINPTKQSLSHPRMFHKYCNDINPEHWRYLDPSVATLTDVKRVCGAAARNISIAATILRNSECADHPAPASTTASSGLLG
ncbi:hypothetical protein OUZ56_021515 [Daphnia magna]|uniref:Uncharacterized protein n=1 Tax=Daphnia magna TaxID=35525 RepID=A0ABQ9ZHM3_9CRUS|nr:hypothetical protein OUZ56_021515 [Daphnia magna]